MTSHFTKELTQPALHTTSTISRYPLYSLLYKRDKAPVSVRMLPSQTQLPLIRRHWKCLSP